jgi:periplasmic protein TonB
MRLVPDLLRSLSIVTLAATLSVLGGAARAQFSMVPAPKAVPGVTSTAETPLEYRRDAARHVYAAFPTRIYRGKLPPLLYGIAIVETEIDAEGKVLEVHLRRLPAAPEVGPWIQSMVRRASPFPAPTRLGEKASFVEIWLVDKGGNFQLDTLTEGQR